MYRINKIDFNISPKKTFQQDGKEITFIDYYKNKYNKEITDKE